LSVLLDDNAHPDGSFETWIIPRVERRTTIQRTQAAFVKSAWGRGPDSDVIANLLYALILYDQDQFAEQIDRGCAFLESQQEPDGSWKSTWYHGPYYGTYVCLRLFAAVSPSSHAVRRAQHFLVDAQRADGGWGDGDTKPLDTALALLALASVFDNTASEDCLAKAERALAYLRKNQADDGSWESCPFIRMELGRAHGHAHRILSYGSRTLTTSFVVKAAHMWHKIAGGNTGEALLQECIAEGASTQETVQ
jgi:squalene-hopene/tetraprenyl-beta-curcumene cyclase